MPGDGFSSNLFILTGAPGTGKTAIRRQLGNEFRCVDEPAREILAEQRATGGSGTWDLDASLFVHLLLQRSIPKYAMARSSGETVVFDRGIPGLHRLRGPSRHGPNAEPRGRRCVPV